MNFLMILTSHDRLGNTGKPTGFWLEELAAPYYVFTDAGATVTLASPMGGRPPLDPASDEAGAQTDATRRFKADPVAQAALADTRPLHGLRADDFDALFYPGGHGPMWDLADDARSIALIEAMFAAGKPVAAVCHAPVVLRHVKGADGEPIVSGRAVTSFANSEERAVGLADVVPFLVANMLAAQGARYSKVADWQPYVVTDRGLITGQNPASSAPAALALLRCLRERGPDGREGGSRADRHMRSSAQMAGPGGPKVGLPSTTAGTPMPSNYVTRDNFGMYANRSDGPGPELMGADTLLGNDVYNRDDEDLGDIKEFMIDMASGRIAYAVLSFGGLLGMGDKLFAVPWAALELDTRNKRFTLDVPKDKLKDAPGFDPAQWPSMSDKTWAGGVHKFYGTPYRSD